MTITASQLTSSKTLDEFRQEFNKLVTDVTDIKNNSTFGSTILFEGSSDDDFETSLTVVNPTADRTITIPNETGTLLTSGSAVTGTTVTITANNSSDETVFPTFVDGATGTQGLESDTGLTYNPSSGVLTSTTFTGALSGNATTATALATGRTIAMTGDVTWTSASFDGSGNVTGTAAIGSGVIVNADVNASAAIAMSKTALVAGTGLTLSTNTLNVDAAQSGITSVGTLSSLVIADAGTIGSASDTDAISIAANSNIGISQNLTITGNLTVNGSTVTNSATNTVIEDTLIELNTGAGSNANDIGFIMERGSTGDNAFMGWDESADKFIVGTTTSDGSATGNLTITTGTLVANLEGNVTGTLQTAAQTNITSVGALDGGSITSGFGTIDTGSSTITTTGNVTGGTLTSTGNVVIADAGNIGSASDTDAIAISAAGVTTFSQRAEFSSDLYLNGSQKELRFYEGANYVGFKAPSLSGDQIWVLPATDASSNGDALVSDGSGGLSFSSTVGSNASSITLADESSDTSCFVLFATAATGNQNPKTGTNLTFNSDTGALTASSFVGNVTGNASGSAATVTGAAQSAITSVGTLTALTVDNISINGTTIGHTSDTDAISIAADGKVTFSQQTTHSNGILIADGGTIGSASDTDALSIAANGKITVNEDFLPDGAGGATLGNNANEWGGLFLKESALVNWGADQDVSITHDPDSGLKFKHTDTADDSFFTLTLQTGDTDIAVDDIISKISFQAPDEGAGTDAVAIAASISAVSEGDFSASNNATKLQFSTGISEAATPAMEVSSTGKLSFPNKQGGDNLLLDQTAAAGTDAGDDVTLNGTDGSSTNANSNIIFEDAVALTTQTDRHIMKRMMGEFNSEQEDLFPNKLRLIKSDGTILKTYHCAGDA